MIPLLRLRNRPWLQQSKHGSRQGLGPAEELDRFLSAEAGETYELVRAAQEASLKAIRGGVSGAEADAVSRNPIEEAGLGKSFRHRMGHGIGMDVHERPFLSPEDETPLEAGMTFTDEPSLVVRDGFGLRIENVVVCADEGARVLNEYPNALVCNG